MKLSNDAMWTHIDSMISSTSSTTMWRETILEYAPDKDELCVKLLQYIKDKAATGSDSEYLLGLSQLFIDTSSHIKETRRNQLVTEFIGNLYDSNSSVREAAGSCLESTRRLLDDGLFQSSLMIAVRALSKKNPEEIIEYHDTITTVLNYKNLFTAGAWRDLFYLIRLMFGLSYPEEIHGLARDLLKEVDLAQLIESDKSDITKDLIGLAKNAATPTDGEETRKLLLDLKLHLDQAKVEQYLRDSGEESEQESGG